MKVHLVDGTYELFRHFYGMPEDVRGTSELGGVRGVVDSVLYLLEEGATHVGVATDHVIESFRNELWPTYKSSAGMDPAILAQFEPLEACLDALGVTVWPMVEVEADDALASAASIAAASPEVQQAIICTPDKDLAQCVRGDRVIQFDRRKRVTFDEAGVVAKFGVLPESIPDYLALVGDSADGYPGLPGWGAKTASAVLASYRHIVDIPPELPLAIRGAAKLSATLAANRDAALLFLDLATLRVDPNLFTSVDELRWNGPSSSFADVAGMLGNPGMAVRARRLAERRAGA